MSPVTHECSSGIPEVTPRFKIRNRERHGCIAQQRSEQLAPLERSRFARGNPIGEGDTALLGPMAEKCGFANPAATIEHDKLSRTRIVLYQDVVEEGKL